MAYANGIHVLCINYDCITFSMHCASDINVTFEDVLDHMTTYLYWHDLHICKLIITCVLTTAEPRVKFLPVNYIQVHRWPQLCQF